MVFGFIFLFACNDKPSVDSPAPIISLVKTELLKDISRKDSLLILTISYRDDDGDIGLDVHDTFPPFNRGSEFQYNLLIDIKEVKNKKEYPVNQVGTLDPENFNQRIPNITPTGKNKKISGEIDIRLDATKNYLYPDSIICRIQVADRALNKSNLITTEIIDLKH